VPEAHPGDWRVAEDGRMAMEDWVLCKPILLLLVVAMTRLSDHKLMIRSYVLLYVVAC
jgi:hypothetical protein